MDKQTLVQVYSIFLCNRELLRLVWQFATKVWCCQQQPGLALSFIFGKLGLCGSSSFVFLCYSCYHKMQNLVWKCFHDKMMCFLLEIKDTGTWLDVNHFIAEASSYLNRRPLISKSIQASGITNKGFTLLICRKPEGNTMTASSAYTTWKTNWWVASNTY